jgi:predicted transporter
MSCLGNVVEYKSLLMGIIFSTSVFAVKSGLGLYYLMRRKKTIPAAILILALFGAAYLVVFWGAFWFITHINLLAHLESAQSFLKFGMMLHFCMALLMTIWGGSLLKKAHLGAHRFGWVPMVVPCPVCMTAILLSLSFTLAAFPESGARSVFSLFGLFAGVGLMAAVSMRWIEKWISTTPETILGAAMITIGAYFFLSVIGLPHVGELDEVYRLADNAAATPVQPLSAFLIAWGCCAAVFLIGYGLMSRKIRRVFTWKSPRF